MKHPYFTLLACLAFALTSCSSLEMGSGAGGEWRDGAKPVYANRIRLTGLGTDVDQLQAEFPDGSRIAIAGLNNSKSFSRAMELPETIAKWDALEGIASGWLGTKNTEVKELQNTRRTGLKETGLTERAKISADAATREAELLATQPTP
jgi:hypothetical protein